MDAQQRIAKLESLLDAYSHLFRQSGTHESIETETSIEPSRFFERYYFGHRPVILRGMIDDWPATHTWSPSYLADRYGDVSVEISDNRESDAEYESNFSSHRRELLLRDYVAMVQNGGRTNDFYLVGKNLALNRGRLSELRRDLGSLPGILDLSDSAVDWHVKFWFGPAGTITPLHHDRTNILFAQVLGRKHFKLIPSFEMHLLYNHKGAFSEADLGAPDFDRFPRLKDASIMDATVYPGDLLFIPLGWWHWVHALDISISVTFQRFAVRGDNTSWKADGWSRKAPMTR